MKFGGVHDSGQLLNTSSLIYTCHFHYGNPLAHATLWFTVSVIDQEAPLWPGFSCRTEVSDFCT